ncbi:hypothetical protein KRX51_09690 [Corynebacterium sp. TAE3-ERU12]|uniref:hypothetical protein n=1 Tax=Corynebacterium sp. TAE3-ERU12 TaxID=2849491 RepID=UPI001C478476|nr:hypothetical protein [Corynebacterium sp. TAE3-ERU12]MBV7296181.1 hypothetical protein [Corynebacterium sp. TAE3-ERU12]
MVWWDNDEHNSDTATAPSAATTEQPPAIPARLPLVAPQPVPEELPELLAFSRHAAQNLNHVASWRAVSAFARDHWLDDGHDLPTDLAGEFYALRHAVADQLELAEEAAEARKDWLDWAMRENRPDAVLHARAFSAFAEAERYADAHGAPEVPTDSEVPELIGITASILDLSYDGKAPYQAALAATVTGAAASLCRRHDLARALEQWAARHAPRRSASDDRRLLQAQIVHGSGDLSGAARLCDEVATDPEGEPVTSTIEARQMLAWLSLEAGEEDEAIRQLRPVAEATVTLDLTVAGLRSHRLLAALLNGRGEYAEARLHTTRALAHARGMPVNPLTMDIELILARSLFDAGEHDEALRRAEPVAQWSMLSPDEERTDAAYTIAAASAAAIGDGARATRLLLEHAGHLLRIGDSQGASSALRQCARGLAQPGTVAPNAVGPIAAVLHRELDNADTGGGADTDEAMDLRHAPSDMSSALTDAGYGVVLELAEEMMIRARELISDGWSIADWHDDLAYIYWASGREDLALGHVDTAAAGYLESGDGVESARALLTGVRCCLDRDDTAGAGRYANRIDQLLPQNNWEGHPVREALAELLGD